MPGDALSGRTEVRSIGSLPISRLVSKRAASRVWRSIRSCCAARTKLDTATMKPRTAPIVRMTSSSRDPLAPGPHHWRREGRPTASTPSELGQKVGERRLVAPGPGVQSAHPESEIPEMMTPERWAIVERLYHAALGRHEAERGPFLAEACAGDHALRREVESLLEHDGGAAFLSTPAA